MRTHVEEPSFREGLQRLFPDPDRADDVLNSITLALGRSKDIYGWQLVRQDEELGSIMLYESRRTRALPHFAVLFTVRNDVIHLHEIFGALPDEDDE